MSTNSSARESLKGSIRQDGSADLQAKVVQLLSNTVNGCLSELGYYPGMQEQFQNLLQTNKVLQSDNAKLYEDNRALARVVAVQNDRLASWAGEENVKLKQMGEMRDLNENLSTHLKKTEELLRATLADKGYEMLHAETQMLQAKNDALQRDFAYFRNSYAKLHELAAGKGLVHPANVPPGMPPMQQPRRTNDNRHNPNVSGTQGQVVSNQLPANPQMHHGKTVSENMPRMKGRHPAAQNHLFRQVSPVQQHPMQQFSEGFPQNQQAIGHVGWPGNSLDPSVSHRARVQAASTTIPNSSLPSDPKAPSAPPRPLLDNTHSPLTPLTVGAQNLPITPTSPNYPGRMPSRMSQGWSSLPPSMRAPQAPDVIDLTADDNVAAPVSNRADATHLPTSSNEEPLSLSAGRRQPPSHNEPVAMSSPASSIEEPLLKRSISDVSGVQPQDTSENEPRKKSRLDDSVDDGAMAVQAEPHPGLVREDTEPDHEAELGGTDLRSAEDCIADIFADDDENAGSQVCNLCILRYERGAIEELPPPFEKRLDVLIAHCINEHPMVWDKLRHSTTQPQ